MHSNAGALEREKRQQCIPTPERWNEKKFDSNDKQKFNLVLINTIL